MQRAKWVLLCLFLAPTLHALDVSYGNFLTITGIERSEGKISLPVERKKYHNIRILSRSTYQFVIACSSKCVQDVAEIRVTILEVRPAKTRPDMWMVTCAFNQDWQGTFLVFRRGEEYSLKVPANLVIKESSFRKKTEETIIAAVKELQ